MFSLFSTVLAKGALSIPAGPLDARVTDIDFRISLLSLHSLPIFPLSFKSFGPSLYLSVFLSRAIIVAICQSNQPLHATARTEVDPDYYLPYTHADLGLWLYLLPGKIPGIDRVHIVNLVTSKVNPINPD